MPTLVLLNPEASQARKHLSRVRGRLVDGVQSWGGEVRVGRDWEETRNHAARARDEGFDVVVAAGGDGTVNAVVDGLLDGAAPDGETDDAEALPVLAVMPLGTGNDLARSLGIVSDLEGGLRSLDGGVVRRMDVLSVEIGGAQRMVANVSAGGFGGRVDEQISDESKERWGPLAYLKTAVEELPEVDRYRSTLRIEGGAPDGEPSDEGDAPSDDREGPLERVFEVANVAVANGRWAAGGILVAPGARLDDGRMDVVVLRAASVARMGLAAALVAAGEPLEHELVETFSARRLSIASEPAMTFNVDGEPMGTDPVRFQVIPGALRVMTGAGEAPAFLDAGVAAADADTDDRTHRGDGD